VTTFDAQGRIVQLRTGTLTPIALGYDAFSRVRTVTQGTRVGLNGYAASGQLASIQDPLLQTTSFDYDESGRLVRRTRADGQQTIVGHDANGNVTAVEPPGRPAHSFEFTAVDLVGQYQPPMVGAPAPTVFEYGTDRKLAQLRRPTGDVVTATYDTSGRMQTLASAGGTVHYAYDEDTGQMHTVAGHGTTVTYAFDGFLPVSEQWSGTVTGRVDWTYDTTFRPATERVGGSEVSFQYDLDGLLTGAGSLALTRHAANGVVTAATVGAVSTMFTYDGFGDATSQVTTVGGTPQFEVSYDRDALGRITQLTEVTPNGSRVDTYSYDAAGRLSAVTRNSVPLMSFDYDGNGNRIAVTTSSGTVAATHDHQDRLISQGAVSYTYSLAGDLLSRSDPLAGTTTYGYDAFGSLRRVTTGSGQVVDYFVDGTNRRVGRSVDGVVTHRFIYQGTLRPIAELDGSGNVTTRFVYGTRLNVPEYMVRGGVTYRILTDHRGSPRFVVDAASGAIAQEMDYDPFGRVVVDTAPGFQPFGFAGGLYDPLTGLVRFGARDYDAAAGRWTARDPLGFSSGDSNLYAYVNNDPVNFVDPSGLCGESDWLKTAADLTAGFGDELTSLFGLFDKSLTELVREYLDWNAVDENAGAYTFGEWLARAYGVVATGAIAAELAGWRVTFDLYKHGGGGINLLKEGIRKFAIDWHPFKIAGQWVNRLHYHIGKTASQMSKHRPWQGGWW
jgi:RHS repeat-associated protein